MKTKNIIYYLATGPAAATAHKKPRVTAFATFFVGARLRVTRRGGLVVLFVSIIFNVCTLGWAEDKSWTGDGDASSWFDAANWLPGVVPTESDDTKIDLLGASVSLPQAFQAKSVTLGGKRESSLTVSNFAVGTIEPDNPTDLAVHNRRDGYLILKGSAGKITLKGGYKDSETVIPDEPSFMFNVQ